MSHMQFLLWYIMDYYGIFIHIILWYIYPHLGIRGGANVGEYSIHQDHEGFGYYYLVYRHVMSCGQLVQRFRWRYHWIYSELM